MDAAKYCGDRHILKSVDAMQNSTCDERGTVRALAREIEEAQADRKSGLYRLHPKSNCSFA
jgi:hypothetical protein